MPLAAEYHQYARECVKSASEAKSKFEHEQFLNMARAWTEAALRLEGVLSPTEECPPYPSVWH
jgi:hypothetical protein